MNAVIWVGQSFTTLEKIHCKCHQELPHQGRKAVSVRLINNVDVTDTVAQKQYSASLEGYLNSCQQLDGHFH